MLVQKVDLNYAFYKGWLLSNLWNPLLREMRCVYLFGWFNLSFHRKIICIKL